MWFRKIFETCSVACLNFIKISLWFGAADSGIESNDSDEEFQICEICTTEEVLFLQLFFESLGLL